jgi:hypothetical protein
MQLKQLPDTSHNPQLFCVGSACFDNLSLARYLQLFNYASPKQSSYSKIPAALSSKDIHTSAVGILHSAG